ncbi:hypothetical protein FA15DRAFT_759113 [Coprinopsis marcescibilis]|uniref:Uncharacterized protein n=1 Tax=Coprinopsis marcescibilis TaxID=230819 RepID=A0A5C3KLI3_COPMA|nr:hypothetical protein FA15DRAFT_759113 [Coprinopsis marcescibilis]
MASPFSMLSMLTKARRATAKRAQSTTSVSDETVTGTTTPATITSSPRSTTSTLPSSASSTLSSSTAASAASTLVNAAAGKDTSDTSSIRSFKLGGDKPKIRKSTLLSRMSSSAVVGESLENASRTPSRPSTPAPAAPQTAPIAQATPTASTGTANAAATVPVSAPAAVETFESTGPVLSESPKMQTTELKSTGSSDGGNSVLNGRSSSIGSAAASAAAAAAVANEEELRRLREQKLSLEAENARLEGEWKGKLEEAEAKFRVEKQLLEIDHAKAIKEVKATSEMMERENQEEKALLEARNAQLAEELAEVREMLDAERAENDAEKTKSDEALAMVERENELLEEKAKIVEATLSEAVASKELLEQTLSRYQSENDAHVQTISGLQLDIGNALEDIQRYTEDEEIYRQKEEALRGEVERIRKEKDADIDMRDQHIDSLNTRLDDTKSQAEALREVVEAKTTEKERAVDELRDQMSAYYQYVEETERRNRMLADQLKRQTMEIKFTRPAEQRFFMRRAAKDEPLDDAVRILKNLNSEIFQVAAEFADGVEDETSVDVDGVVDVEPLMQKLSGGISKDLVRALRVGYTEPDQESNPLLLQVAVQGCLVFCCNKFINSWYPFQWEHGDLLQILYNRMLETGTVCLFSGADQMLTIQTGKKDVAETWRSTTKAMLKLTSEAHPQLLSYLREQLYDILSIVGRSPSHASVENLVKSFEDKVSMIARLAVRLHLLFNGDIPCTLTTYAPQPESDFVREQQEDSYADGGEQDAETDWLSDRRVLCSSDMGLQRNASDENGDLIVQKSRVVLSTILNPEW